MAPYKMLTIFYFLNVSLKTSSESPVNVRCCGNRFNNVGAAMPERIGRSPHADPLSSRDTKQITFTQAQRSRWQTSADVIGDVVRCTPIECSVYEE